MTVAQGINKTVAYKKQSGLGTAASGSGGQLIPRRSFAMNIEKQTYANDLIASHQQDTGITHGIRSTNGSLDSLLAPAFFTAFEQSLLRQDFAAVSAITSLSLTIAASGSNWTVTRAAGDFLTGGIKKGHVVRLTGGSLDSANVGVNLLVVDVTATVLTVHVPSGSSLTAEGPIASCTVTVTGKVTYAPTSSHTNDYYTLEEYFSDLTRSDVFQDVQVAGMDISLPATGNASASFTFVGLGRRTRSGSQVLTTPTAEPAYDPVASVNGAVVIGGTVQAGVTSAQITINGNVTGGEAVIGSNYLPDTQKGRIQVSGSFTAVFESVTLADAFDNETVTDLTFMLADDATDSADFIVIRLPAVKLASDTADDGEKQIVRTYNFTAQKSTTGGSGAADHATICMIQDSTL